MAQKQIFFRPHLAKPPGSTVAFQGDERQLIITPLISRIIRYVLYKVTRLIYANILIIVSWLNILREGFQDGLARKGLAELLANEKEMGPLLGFLKSTEVGGRRSEGTGARMATKKWPGWGETAWEFSQIKSESGGENPQRSCIRRGETAQKWTTDGRQAGLEFCM